MTLKSILIGAAALFSSSSLAATSLTIENQSFNPQNLIAGEWTGEPVVGDIRGYGVERLDTTTAFFEEAKLHAVVASILSFETEQDIHAVHLHGTGSNSILSELHGYTIIFGDEQAQTYQMETYTKSDHGFVIDDDFSGPARGALDCGSAAKLAILHGPANEFLVSISLGKTEYSHEPESEEKYASYLTNVTALLGWERVPRYAP